MKIDDTITVISERVVKNKELITREGGERKAT